MTGPTSSPEEEDLLARLADIARVIDPVPELTYELGRGVFGRRHLDDELATLVADSLTAAGTVRAGAAEIRLVSFQCAGITIDIQVVGDGGRRSLLGLVDGVAAGEVTEVVLEAADGALVTSVVDADARFAFATVPDALVRFRLGGRRITTAWVRL